MTRKQQVNHGKGTWGRQSAEAGLRGERGRTGRGSATTAGGIRQTFGDGDVRGILLAVGPREGVGRDT